MKEFFKVSLGVPRDSSKLGGEGKMYAHTGLARVDGYMHARHLCELCTFNLI